MAMPAPAMAMPAPPPPPLGQATVFAARSAAPMAPAPMSAPHFDAPSESFDDLARASSSKKRAAPPAAKEKAEASDGAVREEAAVGVIGAERWLERQRASGLFGADEGAAALAATIDALRACLAEGLTTSHAIYGAQVKRALYAALALLDQAATKQTEALAALLVLLAEGRITAKEIRAAVEQAKGSGDVIKFVDDRPKLVAIANG